MAVRKIVACTVLCMVLPCNAFWEVGLSTSIHIPLTKKNLLIGAAVGGSILAAVYLYRYFCVMTLPKAERLCNEVGGYIEKMSSKYHAEFAILDKGVGDEIFKSELQNIITAGDSESPYLTYVNALQDSIKQIQSYEEQFSNGISHLQTAMDKLVSKINGCLLISDRENFGDELQRYKNVLISIAGLRELLHMIRFKLQKMMRTCLQFDAYRQEKMLERLQAIEKQLIYARINQQCCNHC